MDSTESDSSYSTIHPKSSHEEGDHDASQKSDPDGATAESAKGTPKTKEEDANAPDDCEDSLAGSEGNTRDKKRLKPTEEKG
jgi:hypothetical protein